MKWIKPKILYWQSGFTLVELMVAMAISTIMGLLLVSVLTGILSSYTRMNDRVLRRSDGSLAANQLVQDLEAMTTPRGSSVEGLQISLAPNGVNTQVNDFWLTLLTSPVETDPDGFQGAPRAVSYRLSYESPIDGTKGGGGDMYSLYRVVADAQDTFTNVLGQTAGQDTQDNTNGYWGTQSLDDDLTNPNDFLCSNVVQLTIRFLRADNNTWTEADQEVFISGDGSRVREYNDTTTWQDISPVEGGFLKAEISVTVLSREGMTRLRGGMDFDDVLRRFSETTVRQTALF